jgi:hypothetical protein
MDEKQAAKEACSSMLRRPILKESFICQTSSSLSREGSAESVGQGRSPVQADATTAPSAFTAHLPLTPPHTRQEAWLLSLWLLSFVLGGRIESRTALLANKMLKHAERLLDPEHDERLHNVLKLLNRKRR